MTWDSDPTEYLCVVHNSEDKKNALVVASADAKFTETLDFDPASDMWRFSEGNVKKISDKARSKGKAKVAANPNIVKAVASKTGEERSVAIRSGLFVLARFWISLGTPSLLTLPPLLPSTTHDVFRSLQYLSLQRPPNLSMASAS